MRRWELLNLVVRKGCKLCAAPADVQEALLEMIERRAPVREVLHFLAERGYTVSEKTYHTHKRHLRQFLERTQSPTFAEVPSMQAQIRLQQMQIEALRLARTREEKARAALDALRDLVSVEHYEVIREILGVEQDG